MSCRGLILAGALALAGCGPSEPVSSSAPAPATSIAQSAILAPATSAPSKAAADSIAHYDGYGDTRFGMDEAAFDQARGDKLSGKPDEGSSCFYKSEASTAASRELGFMFENGQFVRYDVYTAEQAAPGGGRVDMTEAQIRALYGKGLEEQRHKYVDGAKYLRVPAPSGKSALLFETDEQGKISRWRVGVPPQVDYVEGCS